LSEEKVFNDQNESQPPEQPNFKSFIGQTFANWGISFTFLLKFACLQGFNDRKERKEWVDKKDENVADMIFWCHCIQSKTIKQIDPTKKQSNQLSYKSNCSAHVLIKL